ncbi:hypothetical protein [Castellaniella caeni]|uniref:hypothetical protein n=1 Tax=Castellaniella caeni TaxID=266123 RepID=UPI0011AFA54A|nr:hypothetical protein [Castellaniella caeni]
MNLNDVPEDEARALLAARYTCEDYGEWTTTKASPEAYRVSCGLLDGDGARTNLYVEMFVKVSQKTKITHYKFSVMRRRPLDGRVYQLEIKVLPRILKDQHQMPHEHIGRHREPGDATWAAWGFNEVLARFVQQTNIEFRPDLGSPLDFRLRPS